jgi:hypothetical protein
MRNMKIDLRKRQMNAKIGLPHISTKDWDDSVSAQINIESQIDDLDVDETIKTHLKSKINFDGLPEDETEALDALRGMAESINSEIDKFNSGQILSVTKGGSKFVNPQELADDTKRASEELDALKAEQEAEQDEERKQKLKEEYDKKKAERDQMYEDMSGAVSTISSSMIDTGKKLMSGDGQQAVDAVLNILIGIGSFLTKGLLAWCHAAKEHREARKLGKDLAKQDEGLRKAQELVDEIAAGNHDEGLDPATPEEAEEIKSQAAQEDFEEVGEIETWGDAFKYGYAKLKQIHGLNYDEAKARETLEGLKASYPDNPKVVIGALKYGGVRRKKDENQQNSRIDLRRTKNSKPKLKKVFEDFNNIDDAYEWMTEGVGPTEDPVAILKVGGKSGELTWSDKGELVLRCNGLPNHEEVMHEDDWVGQLSDLMDYINNQIRKYGD